MSVTSLFKLALTFCTGGISSFFTSVGPWLLKHWKLVLAIALIGAAGVTYRVLVHELDEARATVVADAKTIHDLGAQVESLQAAQKALEASIATQNASIASMKAASDAAKARATAAMHDAVQQSKNDAATIADLRKRAADPNNKGTCDDEISRLRSTL